MARSSRSTDPTVRASKLLSKVLRHDPGLIGIELDEAGWVQIDVLLKALDRFQKPLSPDMLEQIVAESDKQRFIIEDGRIRANQGHSVTVDLGLQPMQPPALLYHGTVERNIDSIHQSGLRAGSRQHVHLSADLETARTVGARRGKPVILTIDAGRMHRDGLSFWRSANGVWLTDHVPPAYID